MTRHVERIVPHQHYRELYSTFTNHVGRYHFASRFIGPESNVLDLGCGCGYGAEYLAQASGRRVVGMDRSAEGVAYGRRWYPGRRVKFVRGDVTGIPLHSASIDAIVAMEIIEHVEGPAAMLDEIVRVLKPKGLLLISTPNRLVTVGTQVSPNPYHVREYAPKEFRELLGNRFGEVLVFGQDLTPACSAGLENMDRIWHNLGFIPELFDRLHALQCRLRMDETVTGLTFLRRFLRLFRGNQDGGDVRQDNPGPVCVDFRPRQAVAQAIEDWDVQPYDIDAAPVLIAVCRR